MSLGKREHKLYGPTKHRVYVPRKKIMSIASMKRIAKRYGGQQYYWDGETRFGDDRNFNSITAAMDYVLTPPASAPSVSLSSPQAGLYEVGQVVGPVELTANVTKTVNNIVSVIFKRGGTTIHTVPSPNPNGGVESYTDTGSYTTDTTFTSEVSDGQFNVVSNSVVISFAKRVFWGTSPNTSLTENEVEALQDNELKTGYIGQYSFPAGIGEYKYIARPVSFGQVSDPTSKFIDVNTGFPVPFGLPTTVNITNTFGYTENYYVYRSINQLGGAINIQVVM